MSIFNTIKTVYVLEISELNLNTKEMKITTRNLSHSKLLLVQQLQTISYVNDRETKIDSDVKLTSNSTFFPLRAQLEQWGLTKFRKSMVNVFLSNHVLNRMKE